MLGAPCIATILAMWLCHSCARCFSSGNRGYLIPTVAVTQFICSMPLLRCMIYEWCSHVTYKILNPFAHSPTAIHITFPQISFQVPKQQFFFKAPKQTCFPMQSGWQDVPTKSQPINGSIVQIPSLFICLFTPTCWAESLLSKAQLFPFLAQRNPLYSHSYKLWKRVSTLGIIFLDLFTWIKGIQERLMM